MGISVGVSVGFTPTHPHDEGVVKGTRGFISELKMDWARAEREGSVSVSKHLSEPK